MRRTETFHRPPLVRKCRTVLADAEVQSKRFEHPIAGHVEFRIQRDPEFRCLLYQTDQSATSQRPLPTRPNAASLRPCEGRAKSGHTNVDRPAAPSSNQGEWQLPSPPLRRCQPSGDPLKASCGQTRTVTLKAKCRSQHGSAGRREVCAEKDPRLQTDRKVAASALVGNSCDAGDRRLISGVGEIATFAPSGRAGSIPRLWNGLVTSPIDAPSLIPIASHVLSPARHAQKESRCQA